MKTVFQDKLGNMGRKYYEVFGDLEAENHFLRLAVMVNAGLLLLCLAGAFILANRPPVVIRVSEVGKAEAVKDIQANNMPTDPEILYFAKTFMRRFSEYNAYTLSRDISEAMNMMTAHYQKTSRHELIESGILGRVKEAGLNAQIEFKEASIDRRTPEYIVVSLIGVRTMHSFKNVDFKESSLVKTEILLQTTSRSMAIPWGLLVEDYREIVLNKLEANK